MKIFLLIIVFFSSFYSAFALDSQKTVIDKDGNIYKTIVSPNNKKIWLDRNTGAERVCESYNDEKCFGKYYKWLDLANRKDLVCPQGFRPATIYELNAEGIYIGKRDRDSLFNTFLKIPAAGYQSNINKKIISKGEWTYLWTISNKRALYFHENRSGWGYFDEEFGFSVRCIKKFK